MARRGAGESTVYKACSGVDLWPTRGHRGMSRLLLKLGGGSVEILRDVLHYTEADALIAGTKRGDESGHIGMTFQTTEAFDGFEHARGDPPQHHLPSTPALHIPLHVSSATQQALR